MANPESEKINTFFGFALNAWDMAIIIAIDLNRQEHGGATLKMMKELALSKMKYNAPKKTYLKNSLFNPTGRARSYFYARINRLILFGLIRKTLQIGTTSYLYDFCEDEIKIETEVNGKKEIEIMTGAKICKMLIESQHIFRKFRIASQKNTLGKEEVL